MRAWRKNDMTAHRHHQIPVVTLEPELSLPEPREMLGSQLRLFVPQYELRPAVQRRQIMQVVVHDRRVRQQSPQRLDIGKRAWRKCSRHSCNDNDEISAAHLLDERRKVAAVTEQLCRGADERA